MTSNDEARVVNFKVFTWGLEDNKHTAKYKQSEKNQPIGKKLINAISRGQNQLCQ